MAAIRTLAPLLAPARLVCGRLACSRERLDALLAWGLKPSSRLATRLAAQRQLPLWRCEDGFIRSLGLGPEAPPLSLVVDDLGIYYDATRPSALERWIATPLNAAEGARAQALRRLWCEQRVSKYNGAPESPAPQGRFVLVVDQTAGDLSIRCGLADAAAFGRMLREALQQHPGVTVVVKVHPDVAAGRKQGHFRAADLQDPRLCICADGGHPTALLERAEAVYVVTSQLGFEALLWGKPVHCYGMPFYAGWGFTHDALSPPERRAVHRPGLNQLVHAALVAYGRCIDPHHQLPCTPETLIAALGLQTSERRRRPRAIEAFGFKPWKQPILRRFLAGAELRFRRRHAQPGSGSSAMAIWGCEPGRRLARFLEQCPATEVLHLEDGFLRSVGLGANLIDPISWVVDQSGMYYDARGPSDLETFLSYHRFSAADRARGAAVRRKIVDAAITKYNLPAAPWRRPPEQARVVLVPGQVEGDASIRFGAVEVRTNVDLLKAVRRAEPEAWLLYKPHPDVVAGLRQAGADEAQTTRWCDEMVTGGSLEALYGQVEALHVLTSLSGFEALLRGVEVHTWGLPFYAGWGLTHDRHACPRRGRKLDLDELAFGALVAYPSYVSRFSGLFITAEQAIEELLAWRREPPLPLSLRRRIFRKWGRLREWFALDF